MNRFLPSVWKNHERGLDHMCCLCLPLPVCGASHTWEQSFRFQFPPVLIYDEVVFLPFADNCQHSYNSQGCDCNGAGPVSQVTADGDQTGKPENNSECKCPVVNLCTQCQITAFGTLWKQWGKPRTSFTECSWGSSQQEVKDIFKKFEVVLGWRENGVFILTMELLFLGEALKGRAAVRRYMEEWYKVINLPSDSTWFCHGAHRGNGTPQRTPLQTSRIFWPNITGSISKII